MPVPNYENSIPQGSLNKALYVLTQVFDVKSPVYAANAWFDVKGQFLPNYENIRFLPADESEIKSVLGTPVFGDIHFDGGTYNRYDRYSGIIEQAKRSSYTLPYSCLVDFSRENNVITTPVLGGTGTVKEIYGIGDWEITIRGIAFNGNDTGNNAHEQIKRLIEWANISDSIKVSGSVFSSKDISRITIKSMDIQPLEARWNVISFTIQAISDEPIELQL